MSIEKVSCPKCKSEDYKVMGKGTMFIVVLFLACATFFIGIIIWPLLLVSVLLLVASPIMLFLPPMNTCNRCNKAWKVDKK